MANPNLDFAMRVKADLDKAVQDVARLEKQFADLKSTAADSATGLNAAAGATDKAAEAAKREAKAIDESNGRRDRLVKLLQTERGARALQAEAAKGAASAERGLALSAGELKNAQRQLPAQITDIVTGLASGQSVFMVAIQQGGQLKDSWGGIVPAGRALLGAISPVFVAVAAGAATFGLMATAIHQVQAEQTAFNNGLLTTGNYVDSTAQQLEGMAEQIGALQSVTESQARGALLAVVQSGRVAGDQLEQVATAAARMEAATGQSIDTTVQKFEEIARNPVQALLKLNETEHFLTQAQLDRVRALVEEGREQDAAAEGARIYAGRLDDIADAAEAARPHLSQMWREAKEGAASAWESTKNFAEFIAASASKYNELPWYAKLLPGSGIYSLYNAQPTTPTQVPRVADAVDSKAAEEADKARKKAEQDWDRLKQSNLSKQQKLESEIAEIRKNGVALGKSDAEIEGQIAQARARYKESLPKAPKAKKTETQQDQEAAQRELENLTKQVALLGTLADGEKRVSEEARVRYEIQDGAYRLASAATKQQLIDQAKLLDAKREEREEAEKKARADEQARKAYERLREQLETPVEATISEVTKQVNVLNAALAAGQIEAAEYHEQLQRVLSQSYDKAPKLQSPLAGQSDLTGFLGDKFELDTYSVELDKWRQAEIDKNNAFLAQKEISEEQHQRRMRQIRDEYETNRSTLIEAQGQLQLAATQSIFDSMASIARDSAGEQSKSYQVLFSISKGFAAAQAAINMWMSISEAMNTAKHPFPENLVYMAQAAAQGAQVISAIRGVNYSAQGYATGGRIVGPGTPTSDSVPIWASRDEHMIRAASATQPGARAFLDDFNERGMAALYDWQGFGAFAGGGAITEPREPRTRLASPARGGGDVQANMRLYNLFDIDALAQKLAVHPVMEKGFVASASENGEAIRASWGATG